MVAYYVYRNKAGSRKLATLTSPKPSLDVSVVLPTYNEESNMERLILALAKALGNYRYEIVVVDDHSMDKTPAVMDRYAKKGIVAALHRYNRRGIFSAIRDGVMVARGSVVVIMDADFSHPPQLVPQLVAAMKDSDLVSGSRFTRGGGIIAPPLRKFSTLLFNTVIRFILGPSITDWTGGFHAMKRETFQKLRFRHPASWGEFDLELLYRAKQQHFRIKELPFVYNFREEGSSKSAEGLSFFFGYAATYGLRALRLRFFDWL